MIKNRIGVMGEILTVRYLKDRKIKVLTTNYVSRFGEVDVIAEKSGVVWFIEVKTRTENPLFRPADAVDENKQDKIRLTAEQFLSRFNMHNEVRFDVCEVWLDENLNLLKLNYIENAF